MINQRLLTTLAASTVVIANLCAAQDDDQDEIISNWWQVEVIIFSQGNNWATTSEIWPTDVDLGYPNRWQEITPLPDADAALAQDGNEPGDNDAAIATTPGDDEAIEFYTEDGYLNPDIIHAVPTEALQLTDVRQYLDRGRRRILYHGAWRQYLEEHREEAPIIFTAGDQYDDHYELEGSIHVYLQRYLHFDVNLWLMEFSINAGQERQPWPDLPRRPNQEAPASLANLDQPSADFNNPLINNNGGQNQTSGFGIDQNNTGTINTLDWLDQRGNTTFYDSRYDEILSRNYVVNNIALIQQDRPMRSEELHYIDHPLLGILVKITRYQPPIPEGLEEDPLEELLGPRPE